LNRPHGSNPRRTSPTFFVTAQHLHQTRFAPIAVIHKGRRTLTHVIADASIVTNPGSAFERVTNMNGNQDTGKLQSWLDQLAAQHCVWMARLSSVCGLPGQNVQRTVSWQPASPI